MRRWKWGLALFLWLALGLGLLLAPLVLYRLFPPGKMPAERRLEELERRSKELDKRRAALEKAIDEQRKRDRRAAVDDPLLREECERASWEEGALSKERDVAIREAALERVTWQYRLRQAIGW